ncbi:hypothetical protein EO244_13010 [Ancylomarina salipaludis]|uniref:Uncharacterized protein n=1 Tax=Ancylomarina salipaludis TaxID=2501299 RepID=A0A4Q1JKK2_9BACT|nr:hypothetical protein [Ancylomarina salipaludis]RXQ91017.1 hypothetical protein EO244_13010 [Ancylomarina salipaludis]
MTKLKNLTGAKKLSYSEQKVILGGQPMPPANCRCFCWENHGPVDSSCFQKCPDGSIPGQMEGNGSDCQHHFFEM